MSSKHTKVKRGEGMNENCKECFYMDNINDKVANVEEAVKDFEVRITKLERKTDVEKERTDMIFRILNEIKGSIEKIANKIDEVENRPNKLLWGALGTLLGALLVAGLKAI